MLRTRRKWLALAMATLGLSAACGRALHNGPEQPVAQVIFVNQSLDQADVYVVGSSGQTQRIGTVFAGRTETLNVPASFTAGANVVNIVARLLAHSYAPRSGNLTLTPGEAFQITLPPNEQTLTVLPAP